MPIVDTHCHVSEVYYEPVEVLLFQMDRAGVEQAILIQMREEYDNDYQFDCVRRYPGRFASVVLVRALNHYGIKWADVVFLDLGLLLSLYLGYRIAQERSAGPAQTLKAFAPWGVLMLLLFAVGLWILFQPMEMRGTMLAVR